MLSDGTCFCAFQMNGWSLQFSCYSVGTFDIDLLKALRDTGEKELWVQQSKQIMHGKYVFKPFDRLLLLRWWCLDLFTEWTRMGLWSLWESYGNYSCGIAIGNLSRSYWTYCIQILRTKTRLKKSEGTISYPRVQKVSKIRRHHATPTPLEVPPSQTLRIFRSGLGKLCSHSCFQLAWPSKCRSVHQIAAHSMATQQLTMGAAKIRKGVERQGNEIFGEEPSSHQCINLESSWM